MPERIRHALTAAERVRVVVANEEKSNANGHEVDVVWQTIDSAPKDGTLVLATWQGSWPDYPHIEVVYFDGGYWHYAYDGDGPSAAPTHWMPCPGAPSERVRSLNAEQRD